MKYNFEFSRVLFDLAETYGKKVVYSSSAANKGDGGHTPSNLYGWSKYIAEKYGQGLNKGDRKLSDLGEQSKWNYFSIVEQELIESIQNAKTLEFKKLKLERSFFK